MAIKQIGSLREYVRQGDGLGVPANPVGPGGAGAIAPVEGLAGSVARSLAGASELVGYVAKGYREAKTEDVDNECLRVEREFTEWRDKWQGEHQGMDAREAGEAFTKKHEELGRAALERLGTGEHEIFRGLLEKRLSQQNLYALRDGLAYAKSEGEAFSKGQWQGQLAAYRKMIEEHPEDNQAAAFEGGNLLASWRAKNPGMDESAIREQLEATAREAQMETLLAQGRVAEARAVLADGLAVNVAREAAAKGGGGTGGGGGAQGRVVLGKGGIHFGQPGRGHTIAEDLCNPVNIKKVGHNGGTRNDFACFASDAEGFRAAWKQLKIYQHGKRKLATPRQMIAVWAPVSDGNNHQAYVATTQKAGGINVDAPINIDDAMAAARLLKGMATMESPLGGRYTVEEIAAMLMGGEAPGARQEKGQGQAEGQAVEQGGGRSYGLGISPLKAAVWQKRMDEMERRQAAQDTAEVKGALDQFFAKCRDGVVTDPPFTEREILARFGEGGPALARKVADEYKYAVAASGISAMEPAAQKALLESMTPTPDDPDYIHHRELYERMNRALENDRRERADDPVAYLLKHDDVARQKWQVFCENSNADTFNTYIRELETARYLRRMGQNADPYSEEAMTPEPVIGREQAAQLARQISSHENPVQAMRELEQTTGRHFKKIMDQVLPSLGPSALLLSGGVSEEVGQAIMTARKNPRFQQEANEQIGTDFDRKLFEEDISDALKDITQTFAMQGNLSMARVIRDNAQIYAKHLIITQGLSTKDAIKKATQEVVAGRYHVAESPGGSLYRIPKIPGMDCEHTADLLETWLAKMELADVDIKIPGQKKNEGYLRLFRQNLRANASFITNEDESGVYLFLAGRALKSKSGQLVSITWQHLYDMYDKKMPNWNATIPKGANVFTTPMNSGDDDTDGNIFED